MITYEIKKKPTIPTIQKISDILKWRRPQAGHPPNVVDPNRPGGLTSYMGKTEFAHWIEALKKEIKVDDLMTLASVSYTPGKLPVPLFRVVTLQEIHWNAPIGNVHNQPRAVMCTSLTVENVVVSYEPKVLRKLNEEEMKIVNLRNSQASAAEEVPTVRWDQERNAFVCVDENGNVIKEYPGT